MSRGAPRVYVDQADIERLERVATQLEQDRHVEIVLEDGTRLRGIMMATPNVQTFYDAGGNEGLNAFARIELSSASGESTASGYPATESLWVDRIASVERLPNPTPPQPSSRIHPPDPNAPVTGG